MESITHACFISSPRKPHRNSQAIIRTTFDAVAALKCRVTENGQQRCWQSWQKLRFSHRQTCPSLFVCWCRSVSLPHLDPVSGSGHCFSSISHSAPRGLLLAVCVSGGAHSACSPGHSFQYVGLFFLGFVQCGCLSYTQQCGLLDMLTSTEKKNVYDLNIWQKLYRRARGMCWHLLWFFWLISKFSPCGDVFLLVSGFYHTKKIVLQIVFNFTLSFSCSKPARIQGLRPWLPLPSSCRTWTGASSKLWHYSR